jgi:hypothetical protein
MSVKTVRSRGKKAAWFPASLISQGYRPVRKAALEGAQPGEATKPFMNITPSSAIRSNAGVFTNSHPAAPVWGKDWSSLIAKIMFGGGSGWDSLQAVKRLVKPQIKKIVKRLRKVFADFIIILL